jgi:biopolymer transport protein ExbD
MKNFCAATVSNGLERNVPSEHARSSVWSPSQVAAQRGAKRQSAVYPTINVWPFVSVMIVLLVIFMACGTPLHYHLWASLDLPKINYAVPQRNALREDAMRISITKDGHVFFRSNEIKLEQLPSLIHDAVGEGAEKKVYLAVDVRSQYGDTGRVVEQIRLTGIRQICFIAEKLTQH